MAFHIRLLAIAVFVAMSSQTFAQDDAAKPPVAPTQQAGNDETLTEQVEKIAEKVEDEAKKIAEKVDQDPRAAKAAAGILQPIYLVAEKLSFDAFHWVAFALMSTGVFSFALQLVIGKLVVLLRTGFSLKEILSDAVGLAISVFGIVLTTQAAAENSTFTQSPAAVISATIVGAIGGFILYLWGQRQELEAVAGRSRPVKPGK